MAPRRTLIALCSLASSAVVAAILLIARRGSHVIGVDETIGTIPRALAVTDGEVEDRGTPNEVAADRCTASRREDASGSASLHFVVLERGTRRPLPGAQVSAWVDPTGDHNTVRYFGHWIGPDFSAFLTSHGVTSTADAQGMVELKRDGRDMFVAARSNELFGMTEIAPEVAGVRELEIAPSHTVDVIVRDFAGRPCAGVSVGLGACRDSDSFWADVTDASGCCRIHDFEAVVDEGPVHDGDPVAVRLDVAAAPAIEQWIDPARPPSEPIVLVSPPTGTLRVRLVDGLGHLLALDGGLRVSVSAGIPGSVRPFASSSDARVQIRNGIAVVEHVTLHQHLWIDADLDGDGDPSSEVEGPKLPGETIDVDLAIDAGYVLIRGRALDASGTPLADRNLECSDVFDDGREIVEAERTSVWTGPDGRFDWTMKRALDYSIANLRRTCRLCDAQSASAHLETVLPITREVTSEVIDLGDVTLAQAVPLVRGRVVDQAGRGVRNVELETVGLLSNDPLRSGANDFDSRLDTVKDLRACERLKSSADGTFAFYGPCLDLRWAVRVQERSGEMPRIVPFKCASEPMVIVTKATGYVCGTALVDRDWNSDKFTLDLALDGDDSKDPCSACWWMDRDRLRFRIQAHAPARGRVEFRGEDPTAPAVSVVQGIDVLPGVDASPKALADVDLRGKFPLRDDRAQGTSVIELEIVDELGRPIQSGIAWVWTKEERPRPIGWLAGHARIAEPDAHCIEVWAPEHCFHVLSQPLESARIVLKPEIELEIVLALPPELKDPALTQRSMIRFESAASDPMSPHAFEGGFSDILFDRTCKAHVRASASGSYGVEVTLTRRIGPATEDDDGTLETVITQWFSVRNIGGVQTLTFAPDAEERATASKDLGLTKE